LDVALIKTRQVSLLIIFVKIQKVIIALKELKGWAYLIYQRGTRLITGGRE
jgi:hypothetical protein